MNRNLTIAVACVLYYSVPHLVFACGDDSFSDYYWMAFLLFVLFVSHGFVFYRLNTETNFKIKEDIVKKYSSVLFYSHIIFPVLLFFIFLFTNTAFACIDPRDYRNQHKQQFIDDLGYLFYSVIMTSMAVSAVHVLRVRSKKLSAEKKVKLAKIVAASLCGITLIGVLLLFHALFVVAPTVPGGIALIKQ